MADAVQHHLRDRALPVLGLAARLVIDRLGQAFERLLELGRVPARDIGRRRAWPTDSATAGTVETRAAISRI